MSLYRPSNAMDADRRVPDVPMIDAPKTQWVFRPEMPENENTLSHSATSGTYIAIMGTGHVRMFNSTGMKAVCILCAGLAAASCGRPIGGGLFGGGSDGPPSDAVLKQRENAPPAIRSRERAENGTIWDLFEGGADPNVTVEVNKYIWNAALDVLNFLPIQAADPFSGVIVTGYGAPPGGGRAYRATIYVQDPALDARSLTVALNTRGGPASAATVRAVEDAILTRARQLRVRDSKL